MSGEMWADQPQLGVGQWPGWLQYNDARVKLVYERTTFESVSPCLSRFTLHYHTFFWMMLIVLFQFPLVNNPFCLTLAARNGL